MCRIKTLSTDRILPHMRVRTWVCDETGSLLDIGEQLEHVRDVIVVGAFGMAKAIAVPWLRSRKITRAGRESGNGPND